MDYQTCKDEILKLSEEFTSDELNKNEATTRLHLIDRLFFDCLGWEKDDCAAEERYDGKYSDYTFSTVNKVMRVEAKKEGIYFKLPAGEKDGK